MKIPIANFQLKSIDYRDLKPLQGGLKYLSTENYNRLKRSFEEKGLFIPVFVWNDGGEYRILDGHGRERFFQSEKAVFVDGQGRETYEVPCLIVQAENLKDAKEKLLIISSQYQSITQEGLDEFACDLDPIFIHDTLHFDALFNFKPEEEEPPTEAKEQTDSTQFIIAVDCKDEAAQHALYEELKERGFECKLIM